LRRFRAPGLAPGVFLSPPRGGPTIRRFASRRAACAGAIFSGNGDGLAADDRAPAAPIGESGQGAARNSWVR
jgi:hypothetical protein